MSSAPPIAAHPAADLFPLIEGAEFDALCEDIRVNGLRDPIVRMQADDGSWLVLDGRNRLRACERVGVEPGWSIYGGSDPIAYVVSKNLHRRHLDESQRAMVAAKLAALPQGNPAFQTGTNAALPPTQAQAAALLNVSERNVRKAKVVLTKAPPEVIKAVERGTMTVGTAEAQVRGVSPKNPRLRGEARAIADARVRAEIAALLEDGSLGTKEVAKRVGCSPSTVTNVKGEMGLLRKTESPLAKLVSYAQEFSDTWETVLASPSAIERATAEQRKELAEHLQALQLSTRRLIKRLSKNDAEENT